MGFKKKKLQIEEQLDIFRRANRGGIESAGIDCLISFHISKAGITHKIVFTMLSIEMILFCLQKEFSARNILSSLIFLERRYMRERSKQ